MELAMFPLDMSLKTVFAIIGIWFSFSVLVGIIWMILVRRQ